MFYKDANAAVLVYDITRKESFEELEKYWAGQIKESSPEQIILAVAANKSDLIDKEEVDEESARGFAERIGAIFVSTTATQVESINDLFIQIAKKYTGSENIEIKDEEDPKPQFEDNKKDTMKLGQVDNKRPKKKGFC